MSSHRSSRLDPLRRLFAFEPLLLLAMAAIAAGAFWYAQRAERKWSDAESFAVAEAAGDGAGDGESQARSNQAAVDVGQSADERSADEVLDEMGFEVLAGETPAPTQSPIDPSPASRHTGTGTALDVSLPDRVRSLVLQATVGIANSVEEVEGSGSIFAIQDDKVYILTAYHVIQGAATVTVTTHFGPGQKPQFFAAGVVVASDRASDLALVSLTAQVPPECFLDVGPVDQKLPEGGMAAWSFGCESRTGAVCSEVRILAQKRVRRQAGGSAVEVWEVDPASIEGHSGGPMVDPSGRLLGVASGNSGGKAYFTHTAEVYQFLLGQGFGWLLR